ncbi:crossover junction endonuclease EME1 isoform X1 [Sceloporus undulatus]|uniref:crossover junction endonuclease EME1 isoform X1 n=1 Tax=Sceloporus undulatus TaxID=8520 RepID=UPI001C4D9651|nr:crossover junction endonuclease EME1 isoform X1 [Sceloporus undulatus]XP_042303844.1 crossover junction endonuclease EME1 isoform X1 [Sceloporus undulatus]XP_042303845.1 crossover junction endonuclease EME1 isoform X1 [Sceloporus undulatus]
MVSMMFPELGDSEGEELPVFPFLSQQPAAIKNPGQPSANEEVIELRSSDSEGSSAPSPAWKKSRGPQEIARAATHRNVMRQHSSESEDDEEEIVPLAERLKRKLLATKPSADGNSFTRILERSTEDSTGGNRLCSSNEKGETSLLRRPYSQKRVVASTWELSDSDLEPAFSEPEKQPVLQPPVSASDSPMKNVSHRVMGISLQPLPLQANTTDSQEALDQVHKAALQRRKERVARKALQEQEQARKKVLANLWKAQRPDQCLKHIQVILDPGLLQVEGGGQVLTTLQTMECSCVIESQNVPCSITWRRKTRLAQVEQDDLTEEPNLLVLVLLEEFLTMIHNSKQVSMEGPAETLRTFVANIMQKMPGKTLALAVVELEKYFSSHKHKCQKKVKQAVQSGGMAQEQGRPRKWRGKADPVLELSRVDVEEALVGLQLHTSVQVQILESWKEFADFASMFTKAVAEAPFKRERDNTGFSFCLEGDWISGSKVDRSGKGLLQVWKRQIQQFNRVGLEVANAIVAQYPSPMLLMEAYHQCSSEQERYNLLRETPVRRGDGVTATTRRVGPDLSKRIYLQMTSHNPDLSLDITG